jgi:transposase
VLLAGRISIVPKPFPKEFRRDVIAVARQGEQSVDQVAKSFGISESCLNRWLKIADREDGMTARTSSTAVAVPGGGGDLEAENRQLRKRTKQLEQENEILRRATASFDVTSCIDAGAMEDEYLRRLSILRCSRQPHAGPRGPSRAGWVAARPGRRGASAAAPRA